MQALIAPASWVIIHDYREIYNWTRDTIRPFTAPIFRARRDSYMCQNSSSLCKQWTRLRPASNSVRIRASGGEIRLKESKNIEAR